MGMPQYNGPAYFAVEAFVHLLRNYLAWFLVFAILLPAPWVIATALSKGLEMAVESWLPLKVSSLVSWMSFAHVMTFFTFRYYFAPRFPYTSPYATFALAAPMGAALIGLNWTLAGGWMGEAMINRFLWAAMLTVAIAAIGTLTFQLLGWGVLRWGPGRWFGWFVVGRIPFDAFIAAEAAKTAPLKSAKT
ncbi:MAG: hypothetical protein HOP13_19165 [Alphaproteobacteria bacterium]|nr:hypothetical protein [Alphaproteobacteria bacterium]